MKSDMGKVIVRLGPLWSLYNSTSTPDKQLNRQVFFFLSKNDEVPRPVEL